MKLTIYILFLITIIIQDNYGWGAKGHSLINKKAVESLPDEMNGFKKWETYISEHASDPDTRRNSDSTEFPKHFIDIDFYKEFLNGNMITERTRLNEIYGDSVVTGTGILPWATHETFKNLTNAFKEHNKDKILLYAADLGHYVGDAHQPMHTILNYDGQMTSQKGIHARYEEKMIDMFIDEIGTLLSVAPVKYVENPQQFIFEYIINFNSLAPVLFDADNFSFQQSGNRESSDYYRLLWFRTKYVTETAFNSAAGNLASLIYTAWVDAGKPIFNNFN